MLALILIVFPTTVQFPVPTSRAPVTRTDEFSIVDKIGPEVIMLSTRASVLIFPDPLQYENLHHSLSSSNLKDIKL